MSKCHDHNPNEILKDAELKVTPARLAILEVLIEEHGPFSTQEIMDKLPKDLCDQATVFRSLKSLKEKNVVKDVIFDTDRTYYEFNHPEHHHHHIVCTDCDKKEVLENCSVDIYKSEAKKLGFTITDHRIELFGLCSKCRKR